jgi:uncharacterized membrane protein YdcZ (DUF606 family)
MWTRSAGIVLIIIGIIMMAYTGFTYITTKKVVDLDSIQINHEESHPVNWPPYLGAVLLAGGAIIIIGGRKVRI